ncbi:MAG: hypothetical protein UT67_C0002G0010 [Candidatus Magasanikbacteria bacterium GW2011_GWA2_40_10]|uniref:Uncharacterized protein n=1 Tax=Candidatus Magasanikbacteria bacterium GW2011_GWA2_40_10 TaxID=1619037 RepID=A0A0G0QDJ7_9BACT|nr:MAG: hypothetical protein UT67_C0002G0010 [Candidatus Magasanikbacteria bacterium GW2011_GWA2_40_10]
MLHTEILLKDQRDLLPFLKKFSKEYGLVGGTAVALHLGHRRSIDFDLFTGKLFDGKSLERRVRRATKIDEVLKNRDSEFTFFTHNVKVTFFNYPFPIAYTESLSSYIKIPNIITLAAMKAFALGQRSKWKDYVDLYFIMKDYFTCEEISKKARELFAGEFNAKLFRAQLSYFDDIDYREQVEFLPGFEVNEKIIKKALVDFSIT